MLILISPAKNLNEQRAAGRASTVPQFLDEAEELVSIMRDWSEEDIAQLMEVSPKIAFLNRRRVGDWKRQSGSAQAAGDLFDGDVYKTLEMATLSDAARFEAARRLRILSGLYGLLRPTDDVCAYRLEMGRKLPGHGAKTLYRFWGDKIAKQVVSQTEALNTDTILNLASEEYAKSVDRAALGDLEVVSPRFEEERHGKRKVISFSAKRARGAMARWVLEHGHDAPEVLADFDLDGYRYDPEASRREIPVFFRMSG